MIEHACIDCKHSDKDCICVVCDDGLYIVCAIKHKHVCKYDVCDRFEIGKEDK